MQGYVIQTFMIEVPFIIYLQTYSIYSQLFILKQIFKNIFCIIECY